MPGSPASPVRQQQSQAGLAQPLGLARADELVDDDLRAVREVAELRLPHHQRVRVLKRVPQLEPQDAKLRERGVGNREVGPGGYGLPCRRIPFISRDEGPACVSTNRPMSVYRLGEMHTQSCGQSVSAPRGKAGARLNAHTELRTKRQRSAREAIYRIRPIGEQCLPGPTEKNSDFRSGLVLKMLRSGTYRSALF